MKINPVDERHCGKKRNCWKEKKLLEREETAGKRRNCRKEKKLPERKETAGWKTALTDEKIWMTVFENWAVKKNCKKLQLQFLITSSIQLQI